MFSNVSDVAAWLGLVSARTILAGMSTRAIAHCACFCVQAPLGGAVCNGLKPDRARPCAGAEQLDRLCELFAYPAGEAIFTRCPFLPKALDAAASYFGGNLANDCG